ncbi:hypothetical protein IJH23_03455 [Candidatus Saccharibacteria bacterium]|nr:hypothetical protein [Candidatus Saccharibacteria bacterium]
MALFFARFILVILGSTYASLGIYMAVSGVFRELARRIYLPMMVLIGTPPPAMFEDPDFDEEYDRDFIPFIVTGVMLAIVGFSFLLNIP